MRTTMSLLGIVALSAAAAYTTTFSPIGFIYKKATVNGTVYTSGFPVGVLYDLNGTTFSMGAGSSTSRTRTSTGSMDDRKIVSGTVSYQVSTNVPLSGYSQVRLTGLASGVASAEADSYKVGAYTAAAGGAPYIGPGNTSGTNKASAANVQSDGPPDKSKTVRIVKLIPTSSFANAGSGYKAAVVDFPLPSVSSGSSSFNPSSGGPLLTCTSTASGSTALNMTGLSLVGGPIVLASTQTFLDQLTIQVVGGTVSDTYIAVADAGTVPIAFDEYGTGSYDVYLNAPGALRKKVSFVVASSGAVTGGTDFTLKFGDLDGDNTVSSDEVSYVYSQIGYDVYASGGLYDPSTGTLGTVVNGRTLYPYMADLNRDGVVTSADYNMALANSGLSGD